MRRLSICGIETHAYGQVTLMISQSNVVMLYCISACLGTSGSFFKIKGQIEEEKDSIICKMVGYVINFQYNTYCNIVITSRAVNLFCMAILGTDFLSHILIIKIEF